MTRGRHYVEQRSGATSPRAVALQRHIARLSRIVDDHVIDGLRARSAGGRANALRLSTDAARERSRFVLQLLKEQR